MTNAARYLLRKLAAGIPLVRYNGEAMDELEELGFAKDERITAAGRRKVALNKARWERQLTSYKSNCRRRDAFFGPYFPK